MSQIGRVMSAGTDTIRAEQMAKAASGLAEGLKHLSSGDLTFRLNEPFASDFKALRSDFNAAVGQLALTRCQSSTAIEKQTALATNENQALCRAWTRSMVARPLRRWALLSSLDAWWTDR